MPLKELLVVTYTEAAASEMKSRIAAALTEAAENDPFAESQLLQLGAAKIMTFHAFCLTILRRYFYTIGLDPSFNVADEKRAAAIREDALDEAFADAFADEDGEFRSSFTDFLSCYSKARDERKVREMILDVFDFIITLPNPFAWLEKNVSVLFAAGEAPMESQAVSFAFSEIGHRIKLARFLTEKTGEILDSFQLEELSAKNAADLKTVSRIEKLFLEGDMDGTRDAIKKMTFETFRASADEKDAYEEVKELIRVQRDRVKAILRKEVGEVFFARPSNEYAAEIAHIAPYALLLEKLVKRFAEAYARSKLSENVLDFSDLEHMALKILKDESIAEEYQRRFSHIFIDEYQDSNYVQETLISRIARPDNVFMVGDVKQSIYGFRNAVPAIFLDKYRRYPTDLKSGSVDLRIDLSRNFRSKAGVIDAVNALFENVMESHYSEMDYDKAARLIQGVSYDPEWEGKTLLHLVQRDAGKEAFGSEPEAEAALCAGIILDTVGKDFYDAKRGVTRPLRYGDIVILLAKAKGVIGVYRNTLEACGIPAITDRGEGYFETVEIDTFLGLLRAIVNLRRDVPLAAAICSAVFGFELAELAEIRSAGREGFFYTAFLSYAKDGEDEKLRDKCAKAAARLALWRDEERFMRLDDFLWKLMRESGFYDYVSALPRGAQRKANLRSLLDRAADYQVGRVEGLRGFLAFLDRIRLRGGAEQANLITDGEDVCRIMTIHGSKGREFPVVLLPGLGRSLSSGGFRDDSLLLHRDVGLSLHWVDAKMRAYKKTLLHSAVKLRQKIDDRAEAIRLLYVGMTRAMDTLHMIGTMSAPEQSVRLFGTKGAAPDINTDIFGATNYLQLVLPTAAYNMDLFDIRSYDCDSIAAYIGVSYCLADIEKGKAKESQKPAVVGFDYPYAAAAKLKAKYSVTELNKAAGQEEPVVFTAGKEEPVVFTAEKEDPVFFTAGSAGESDEDAGLTAAERGTALHKALELLDFSEAYAHRDDKAWFEAFEDADTLYRFANSDLLARAAASGFLMKEAPFNMKMPYSETRRGKNDDNEISEEIVIQGVIDCLFEEGDGLVIADYKSGWFDVSDYENEAERMRSVYGEQLRLYRRAVELIFGKSVKDCLIYMTGAGVTVDII